MRNSKFEMKLAQTVASDKWQVVSFGTALAIINLREFKVMRQLIIPVSSSMK